MIEFIIGVADILWIIFFDWLLRICGGILLLIIGYGFVINLLENIADRKTHHKVERPKWDEIEGFEDEV
jgi:hypothetical protein